MFTKTLGGILEFSLKGEGPGDRLRNDRDQ